MDKILLSRTEAAAALGVSTRSLDYLIRTGGLVSRRIGRKRLVAWTELKRFASKDHPQIKPTPESK